MLQRFAGGDVITPAVIAQPNRPTAARGGADDKDTFADAAREVINAIYVERKAVTSQSGRGSKRLHKFDDQISRINGLVALCGRRGVACLLSYPMYLETSVFRHTVPAGAESSLTP